jgi:hypothetical protein
LIKAINKTVQYGEEMALVSHKAHFSGVRGEVLLAFDEMFGEDFVQRGTGLHILAEQLECDQLTYRREGIAMYHFLGQFFLELLAFVLEKLQIHVFLQFRRVEILQECSLGLQQFKCQH